MEPKILYIIRGLPGSGKSTLANKIADIYCEADKFFMDENGVYRFDPFKLSEAHQWCQAEVRYFMQEGIKNLAVANTFVKRFHMMPYYELATEFDYKVIEITVRGMFGSIHNVPESTIDAMRNQWES